MGPEKELFALTKAVEFRPCAAATLKACALIGLHMITEEAASLSLSDTNSVEKLCHEHRKERSSVSNGRRGSQIFLFFFFWHSCRRNPQECKPR